MFTFEIRINGSLIAHIYGRNLGTKGPKSEYCYEYYQVENRELVEGKVKHAREDGIETLIQVILKDVALTRKKKSTG